ncbi:MAG: hypothetical protein R2695_04270 [Acidimicrobiales bacterium]
MHSTRSASRPEDPFLLGGCITDPAHHQHSPTSAIAASTTSCPVGDRYAARPLPIDIPAKAIPAGTSRTNSRANRARLTAAGVLSTLDAARRSSAKRGEPAVEVGAAELVAMRSISQAASAVGSASSRLSTATVRAKSVVSSHSREAEAKAGRRVRACVDRLRGPPGKWTGPRRRSAVGSPRSSAAMPPGPPPPVAAAAPVGGHRKRRCRCPHRDRREDAAEQRQPAERQ